MNPVPSIDRRSALRALLGSYSVEVVSVDKKSIDTVGGLFPAGTEIFVASLPKDPPDRMIPVAARLREMGFNPVPHIVARNIANEAQLSALLRGLAQHAGIDRALVLGGDRDVPAGSYDCALQLLQSGLLGEHGIRNVFISCYPEGHSRIPEATLDQALRAKLAAAGDAKLAVTLISQFCFDAKPIIDWTQRLRAAGISVPYRVGVAGPASRANLMKFALMCGIGPSLRVLREREHLAKNMLAGETPEAVLTEVAETQGSHAALGIAGVHFFTFGSLVKTAEWIASALDRARLP